MRAKFVNEVFDVLTWSENNLDPEIYRNVKDSHDGRYGEKVEKSLLKCQSGDDILKWHNRTFEIGPIEEAMKFQEPGEGNVYRKMGVGKSKEMWRILAGKYAGREVEGELISSRTVKTMYGNFHHDPSNDFLNSIERIDESLNFEEPGEGDVYRKMNLGGKSIEVEVYGGERIFYHRDELEEMIDEIVYEKSTILSADNLPKWLIQARMEMHDRLGQAGPFQEYVDWVVRILKKIVKSKKTFINVRSDRHYTSYVIVIDGEDHFFAPKRSRP